MIVEGAKDETPRWLCCKICVRLFFMKHFYDAFFGEDLPDGIPQREIRVQQRHDDLGRRYDEFHNVKNENRHLQRNLNL